jgi:hypothetical protein
MRIIEGQIVQFLTFIVLISCVVFGVSRVHADNTAAPPAPGTGVDQSAVPPIFWLDLKTDRTASAADSQGGTPLLRKEPMIPFIGLSITRPLDPRN